MAPAVATIGFFDGVHRGHRFLLDYVIEEAENRREKSMVVTFPDSPANVLNPAATLPLLNTPDEKVRLLHEAGIDIVAMMTFTTQLASFTAEEYMDKVLCRELKVDTLVMGYDHRFGKKTNNDAMDYSSIGHLYGIDVIRYSPFKMQTSDSAVSSSAIRTALAEGDVSTANHCLGYNYAMEGRVVGGHHVGTSIGFPTANLLVDTKKLVPANGVYAVDVTTGDGEKRRGMLNIGRRPTLDNGTDRSIEVNIFGFEGNLYDKSISLSFIKFIRTEQRFESIEQLRQQLIHDRNACINV